MGLLAAFTPDAFLLGQNATIYPQSFQAKHCSSPLVSVLLCRELPELPKLLLARVLVSEPLLGGTLGAPSVSFGRGSLSAGSSPL